MSVKYFNCRWQHRGENHTCIHVHVAALHVFFCFCLFSFIFLLFRWYCIFQFQWVKHATSDYGTQIMHIVFDWLLRTWKDIIFNFAIWLFVLVQTWIVKTILRHWWTLFSNIRQLRFVKKKMLQTAWFVVCMRVSDVLYILEILKH